MCNQKDFDSEAFNSLLDSSFENSVTSGVLNFNSIASTHIIITSYALFTYINLTSFPFHINLITPLVGKETRQQETQSLLCSKKRTCLWNLFFFTRISKETFTLCHFGDRRIGIQLE